MNACFNWMIGNLGKWVVSQKHPHPLKQVLVLGFQKESPPFQKGSPPFQTESPPSTSPGRFSLQLRLFVFLVEEISLLRYSFLCIKTESEKHVDSRLFFCHLCGIVK